MAPVDGRLKPSGAGADDEDMSISRRLTSRGLLAASIASAVLAAGAAPAAQAAPKASSDTTTTSTTTKDTKTTTSTGRKVG